MSFPYFIKPVKKQLNERLMKDFTGERIGYVHVGDKKWCLPAKYAEQAAGYYNFPLREDDVWVVTFPRSGTTWTQEFVWLVNNNLDYETAGKTQLFQRFPFFEFSVLLNKKYKTELISKNPGDKDVTKILDLWDAPGYEKLSLMPSPRHMKSHLPLSLLPPKLLDTCKVVYVARNPKDVAVSYYHHNRLLLVIGYQNDFKTYWKYFQNNSRIGISADKKKTRSENFIKKFLYSPYWDHILEAWEQRNHPNMLFLFYEELTKDMPGVIKKVSKFFGKDMTAQDVEKLADHLHIDNFKKNPMTHPTPSLNTKGIEREGEPGFIRKGGIGGSKEYFTPEMNEEAEKWINEHLKNTDLRFPY